MTSKQFIPKERIELFDELRLRWEVLPSSRHGVLSHPKDDPEGLYVQKHPNRLIGFSKIYPRTKLREATNGQSKKVNGTDYKCVKRGLLLS
jgi:hypothetical protein